MNEFDSEMLTDFLLEACEQLEILDQELVKLEDAPEDRDCLNVIFRVMHTLKGGAGFLGLDCLEGVAHKAETVLDMLRDGRLQVDRHVIDVLLESADAIRQVVASLENDQTEGELDVGSLKRRLDAVAAQEGPPPAAVFDEADEAAVAKALEMAQLEDFQASLMAALEGSPASLPPTPAEVAAEKSAKKEGGGNQVRVKVELLDKLMNLVGELVLSRNQILQLAGGLESVQLNSACQRINLVTSELQEHIMQTRMQPIGTVLKRFPRLVRDLAAQTGKEVRLTIEGQDTGLDRTVVEAIKDPLTHILRNSIDHGLEPPEQRVAAGKPPQGNIHIRAYHEGGQVTIEFIDDGRGIDPANIREKAIARGVLTRQEADTMSDRDLLSILFRPGFSTAAEVTNLSGRGVGMDVVKSSTEKIGGSIDLQSAVGQGTTVKMRIPLTLAIIPALIVETSGERYAIPQVNLQELVRLEGTHTMDRLYGAEVYRLRGQLLPLLRLRDLLGLSPAEESSETNIVVLNADTLTFGLIVDGVCDTEEIVVKPLGTDLKRLQLYAGATIMGDGRIALILDVGGLARAAELRVDDQRQTEREAVEQKARRATQALLMFNLGDDERFVIPLALVSRLEEFERSRVETISGQQVVQYRGKLLPLIDLARQLGCAGGMHRDVLHVLVFEREGRALGLMVEQILDVIEDELVIGRTGAEGFGVLGSGILCGKAVSVVDLEAVISSVQPDWLSSRNGNGKRSRRVLLAAAPSFTSALIRSHLETDGHRVYQVEQLELAFSRVQDEAFDCLLLDPALSGSRRYLERHLELPSRVPVLALDNGQRLPGVEMVADTSRDGLLRRLESICEGVPA
ncbi:MAG: chemotaxis protein CheW [Vulcanimicrobiota bacterium]